MCVSCIDSDRIHTHTHTQSDKGTTQETDRHSTYWNVNTHTRICKHAHSRETSNKEMQTKAKALVVMHTREPSCDHDWGNREASEEICPRLTLTCITGSDRIYACCIKNNNNKNMFKKKKCAHAQQSCTWPCICMHVFVWLSVHLRLWMFSPLYGQCRSINNATLAEVKEACMSGGGTEGEEEGERDSGRQREWGDGPMEVTSMGEC